MNTYKILQNKAIKDQIFELKVACDDTQHLAPGMFYNLTVPHEGLLLNRPISLCDKDEKSLTFTYKVFGLGTKHLSSQTRGEIPMLGPLGNSFPVDILDEDILIIGSGIGIAPMVLLAKTLHEKNKRLTILLSARTKEAILYKDVFSSLGRCIVITDDGSLGFQGNPIDYLNAHSLNFTYLYACGPEIMLKRIDELYRGIKRGSLLLEERMACGFGACMGCVKKTQTGYIRVCKEGPSIELGVLDYES